MRNLIPKRRLSLARRAIFPAALVWLAVPAQALDCRIRSAATATVGTAVPFTLVCDEALTTRVAWEFGDGDTLAYGGRSTTAHAYAASGDYTVFARIEGEDIPASTSITVLNAVSQVASTHSATLLQDRKRRRLWNVNVDNHSVTAISTATLERIKEIPVGRSPRTLAQDAQGRIWVTGQDDATLTVLDGDKLEKAMTISLPHASRPYGICADPAGTALYVTLEALGTVLKLDAATGKITDSLKVFPTPRGIAVAPDGKTLWVTRFISPRDRGEVAKLSAAPFALIRIIPLALDGHPDSESNGRGVPNALSSLTLSPDGLRLWAPFKKDNVQRGLFADPLGPQTPTFESTVRTGVAQIHPGEDREIAEARLDLDNRSMACAVAFSGNGAFAFLATETSNEIAVYSAAANERVTAIEPRFLDHELGPDGLEVAPGDSLLFIHDFLSREVAVYSIADLGGGNLMPRVALIPTVGKEELAPAVLRGKQVFYNAADPRMARDKYMSCAVCHLDGGGDGRVWDFTHKGEGLRRTPSLRGKAGLGQGPLHWSANFDEIQDFEHDMRDAFLGSGFMDDALFHQGTRDRPLGDPKAGKSAALDELAAYVTSLARARPSPFRRPDGSMTDAAKEGEKIFHRPEVGCAVCHVPPLYTDSRLAPGSLQVPASGSSKTAEGFLLHDVGTLGPGSGKRLGQALPGLDTPTLKGLWESNAFLHDGSAATLIDVITTANPNDRHGKTSQLSLLEKQRLVAFLMQLDDGAEQVGILMPRSGRRPASGLSVAASRSGEGVRFRIAGAAGMAPPVLEILGVSGRLERRLPGPAEAGDAWTIHWDGRDRQGRRSLPGVYLARARSADRQALTSLIWIP